MSQVEGPIIGLNDILRGMIRRKALIITLLALGIFAGVAVLLLFKPTYQTEAQIIVENQQTPLEKPGISLNDTRIDPLDKSVVMSQVTVLKSDDLAARVIDKLNLTQKPEFNPLLEPIGLAKKLLVATGFSDDPTLFTPQQLALKKINSAITVYQIPETNVIGIKYLAGAGALAADVANALAETYVDSTRESVVSANTRTREWLGQQIADLRAKVQASDNAVEKYRNEAGLLKGERATLGTQQISELNSQITIAATAADEANARAAEIRSMLKAGSIDASSDVLASPTIQNLQAQLLTVTRKMSELSTTYLPNHPRMIAVQKELADINTQIRREALKIVDSLTGQAKVATARADALKANLDRQKGEQGDANVSDVKLQGLQRDADADRKLLESMLGRYADANARQDLSSQPAFARVIQKAIVPPTPYFPKPGPILLLTSLAGLILGLGLAFLSEVVSAASRTAAAPVSVNPHPARAGLVKAAAIPELGVAPLITPAAAETLAKALRMDEPAIDVFSTMPAAMTLASTVTLAQTLAQPDAPLAQAATRIASAVAKASVEQGFKTFSFVSLGSVAPNAAMAVVAVARSLAANGLKVIALDVATAGPPGFDALFGLTDAPGLSELLDGRADFTKIVVRDPQSGAHVIRLGGHRSATEIDRVKDKIESVIKALHSIYQIVLLHGGEASGDTPGLIHAAQGNFLLVGPQRLKDAPTAIEILKDAGIVKTFIVKLDMKNQSETMVTQSA